MDDASLGTALTAEFPQGTSFSPPADAREYEQRKSGWSTVLDKIQSDPQLQGMVLRMGLQMMQPKPRGQTTGGHIASAMQDSLDWLSATQAMQQKAGLAERKQALDERRGVADVEHIGAQTAASRQAGEQGAAMFPTAKAAGELKLQGLQNEQKKLDAMAAAGMFTPEYYALQTKLENDKTSAYTEMLRAHSDTYRASADAARGKFTDKAPKVNTIELPDGGKGVVTTQTIGGKIYHSLMAPALMSDPTQAAALVDKEIKQETGKWFGQPKFAPLTPEQYRAKRLQELTKPRTWHMDVNGGDVPKLPQEAPAGVGGSGAVAGVPKQLSTRDKNLQKTVQFAPGEQVDNEMSIDTLAQELVGVNQKITKAPQGSPEMQGLVEARAELQRKINTLATSGTNALVSQGADAPPGVAPAAGAPQRVVVEGTPGNLRVAGQPSAGTSGGYQPGMLQRMREGSETTVVENKKAQGRVRLQEIRAKQRAKIPLTASDREVLALMGEPE